LRLFDTSFIVDLVNADLGAGSLAKRVDEEHTFAALSVISVHEYLFGIYYKHHEDNDKLQMKLASAKRDLSRFEILPLTKEIVEVSSRIHAQLERKGQTIGINDVYIASTAFHFKLKLVTRNSEHYKRIPGLKIETY